MVRLKGLGRDIFDVVETRFNSKMVRLKAFTDADTQAQIQFQFQNGAIKRMVSFLEWSLYLRFNSKMVRLKASKTTRLNSFINVSIPKWCD